MFIVLFYKYKKIFDNKKNMPYTKTYLYPRCG